ncbi:hypothetical protein [Hymenobacter cellulosilyticus]|uniref:Translation initiation factor 2 n=1 Tax=Hymenobacter cellulosilyticus TaxID=2932248 RepID=A0A8T9Q4Z3_9BACT|nr:hypothetical protein [Hymenobacter cellulosilyticus]UOQ72052.1 hypothetical protein MUN79_26330 [Hymenobacter cellulosilyticus]
MKHVSGLLHKLTAFAAIVVALSSCNRAEYAMLPKTSSYHGTANRAVSVKPAPVAATPAPEVAAVPEAAPAVAPATVASAPAAPATASKAVSAAPAVKEAATVAAVQPATKAQASRKLNLIERSIVAKVAKKAEKLSSKMEVKKHSEVASTNKLQGKLRQGVILLLVGLLIEILGAATGIGLIYVLGAIIALIGLVLIILYLLDEL